MPKPVPPPPKQPSEEETQHAVRLVWLLGAAFILCFLALSSCYHSDALMVKYGRSDAISWNVYRAQNINVEKLRAHDGQKVAWLIGSSILRESFDEAYINKELEAQNSVWRVRKFGMTRGAAGVSSGLLRILPLQAGDVVIHSVAMGNFRKDWLEFNGVPAYRLMQLMTIGDFWKIGEWSLADKMEQASAIPSQFYAHHESYMTGLTEWSFIIMDGLPKEKKPGFHTRYHSFEKQARGKTGSENPNYFPASAIDFSPQQFNMQGLYRMRELTSQNEVELVLIDIPPRLQYTAEMIHPRAQEYWEQWRIDNHLEVWPQLPEADYYDLKHPNFRGRKIISRHLIQWLNQHP